MRSFCDRWMISGQNKGRTLDEMQGRYYDDERLWPFIRSGILCPPWNGKTEGRGQGSAGVGWGLGLAYTLIIVDFAKALNEGLNKIISDAKAELRKLRYLSADDIKKHDFLEAVIISLSAIVRIAERFGDLAEQMAAAEKDRQRKNELIQIAETCRRVPGNPARTFREAMQSFWFIWLMVLGRRLRRRAASTSTCIRFIDRTWIPERSARIRPPRPAHLPLDQVHQYDQAARRKVQQGFCWVPVVSEHNHRRCNRRWRRCHQRTILSDARGGGRSPDLPALGGPALSRQDSQGPADQGGRGDSGGLGYPAIMNDNSIIPKHLIRGATLTEARDYCTNCVETDVPGCTDSRAHSGYVNFPKCLLLALNDGKDLSTGEQLGPHTGRLECIRSFPGPYGCLPDPGAGSGLKPSSALRYRGTRRTRRWPRNRFYRRFWMTALPPESTRQQGGARYNFSGIFGVGLSSAADGLAALKKLGK